MSSRWESLQPVCMRNSPFAPEGFEAGEENLEYLQEDCRVLVIGAGGLGCELLKDLALSGFQDIEVIDMDTIDISNLNRQFLFRKKDTGKYKAQVAAEFVMKRCKGVKVKAHTCKVQEKPKSWYKRFNIVIAGLDNIEARQWINNMLHSCVDFDPSTGEMDPDSIIPMIDGGTTGFAGQSRVIIPFLTACFQCSLKSLPPEEGFHLCTLASKPRKPEHCIAYVIQVLWSYLTYFNGVDDYKLSDVKRNEAGEPDEGKSEVDFDSDNAAHMTWVWRRAVERAKEFNIKEPTYNETMQVTKNIIPAIASTNAIISAACANEAFKFLARTHPRLNSYFQYNGASGIASETFPYQRDTECDVCVKPVSLSVPMDTTLQALLDRLSALFPKAEGKQKAPAINHGSKMIYADMAGMDFSSELAKPLPLLGLTGTSLLVCSHGGSVRRVLLSFSK